MHIFWARLASFGHLGPISDPLIVSKFHNETHDPKGQENKIYAIVRDRETFYRHHTVPVTSCNEVKYVLKRVSVGSKECTKELKPECAEVVIMKTQEVQLLRLQQNRTLQSWLWWLCWGHSELTLSASHIFGSV